MLLNNNHGPLNRNYVDRIIDVINLSLSEHPRTMAIRVDLRLPYIPDPNAYMDVDTPVHFFSVDRGLISRFFASLCSQIKHDLDVKRQDGKRVHECTMRYVWVKECSSGHKWHYHVLILLNKDTYGFLGNHRDFDNRYNLIGKIRKAWSSALNGQYDECAGLVHIPDNPIYYLNVKGDDYYDVYSKLVFRCSYMAKYETKPYGDGGRCFGCSQK